MNLITDNISKTFTFPGRRQQIINKPSKNIMDSVILDKSYLWSPALTNNNNFSPSSASKKDNNNEGLSEKKTRLKALEKEVKTLCTNTKMGDGFDYIISEVKRRKDSLLNIISQKKRQLKKLKRDVKKLELKDKLPSIGSFPKELEEYFLAFEGNLSFKDIKNIGKIYKEISSKKSSLKTDNNSIKTLEESEVWQEMIGMLDIPPGKNPVEIDVQYYLLGHPAIFNKLKKAAENGHKVRVLVNPGKGLELRRNDKIADCTQVLRSLNNLKKLLKKTDGNNMGVFVLKKENLKNLMHRKYLRVGEKVFAGGMNGAESSGENCDYGMIVEGPASKKMADRFSKDLKKSAGKTMEDLFGEDNLEILKSGFLTHKSGEKNRYGLYTSSRDFCDLITLLLPEESRNKVEKSSDNIDKALNLFKECDRNNISISDYGFFCDTDKNGKIDETEIKQVLMKKGFYKIFLTDKGRELICKELEKSFEKVNSQENLNFLKGAKGPEGSPAGSHKVFAAQSHEELQAMMVYAINSAEEFLYIPAFFMSKSMAELIGKKKKKMEKEGKKFDLKVILEPALHPGINVDSYMVLEDYGVPVKWALLNGTGTGHNKRLHSKMIVSDKVMVAGSTNLTKSGLLHNEETSVMAFVEPHKSQSISKRDEYKNSFSHLWNDETFDIDTKKLAEKRANFSEEGRRNYRVSLIEEVIKVIGEYEKEFGEIIEDKMASNLEMKMAAQDLKRKGFHEGWARLLAFEKVYERKEDRRAIKNSTYAMEKLRRIAGWL